MRIIKESRLREYTKHHSKAAAALKHWRDLTRHAKWGSFTELRTTFGSADQVPLAVSSNIVVFNIAGGAFRLITAMHYDRQIVYIRRFLTHAEYSKEDWKNDP